MRPLFADPELEERFSDDGFVVVDLVDEQGVAELIDLHARTTQARPGFHYSMQARGGPAKAAIVDGLTRVYETTLAPILPGHDVMMANFVVKGATGESTLLPHLDWSHVDEEQERSVNVWVALCATDDVNGALAVMRRSHRLPLTRRGSATPPWCAAPPDVVGRYMTTIPMRPGQAILYEPRVIHGSATNRSGRERIAAGLNLVHRDARPLHYVGDRSRPEAPLREVLVDREFFLAGAIDPALDHDPEIEQLIAGRESRTVAARPPVTAQDLAAVAGVRSARRLPRLLRRG